MFDVIFIIVVFQCYVSSAKPDVQKEYIAKYKQNLVIDCKFKKNATDSVVNNVRLSSDKSKILAYINGKEKISLTGNYKAIAAKLTMSIERRAANHLRIYFEEMPRSLNNVSVLCYTTTESGMGTHLMEIRNVILLMQAPRINNGTLPTSPLTLREGEMTRPNLTCNASGLPAPVVEWFSPSRRMVSSSDDWGRGSTTLLGGVQTRAVRLKFPPGAVTRRWAGVYLCEARFSNEDQRRVSRNPEDRRAVKVNVHYKPSITMTERVVYSDVGANEVVQINADANPKPKVRCALLNISEPRLVEVRQTGMVLSRHSVSLLRIRPSDVGRYLCNASNYMGTASISFLLSITPPTPRILSTGGRTQFSDYYNLRWETESKARLKNVTAAIRVKQNGTFVHLRNETKKLDVSRGTFDFHLTNLTHNTEHQVRARVCSYHACSSFSSPHAFQTRHDSEGSYTVHPNVYRVQAISEGSRSGPPGSCSALRPPTQLLLSALFLLFGLWRREQ